MTDQTIDVPAKVLMAAKRLENSTIPYSGARWDRKIVVEFVLGLSGCIEIPEPLQVWDKGDLEDLVDEAIQDSFDEDWTSGMGARSVVDTLLEQGLIEVVPF